MFLGYSVTKARQEAYALILRRFVREKAIREGWIPDTPERPAPAPVRPAAAYLPHAPTPKQAQFLSLECQEAFYGGAAGGGKSEALLMAALQYVDRPGYAALLLRRTYADLSLPGALMDRANDWLRGTDARWKDTEKTWLFPSGATLTFGYLENEAHKYRYQGSELAFVGFDELTQFTETQYRYLFSRLRQKADLGVPARMRAASNPGGVGHDWVRQRFLVEGEAAGRVFVPAALDDNPHVDREGYRQSLAQLDPVTRAQLLSGDWEVVPNDGLFRREWFTRVEDAAPAGLRWARYWDLAASVKTSADYTASAAVAFDASGTLWIRDVIRGRWEWPDARKIIVAAMLAEPATVTAIEEAMHGLAALQELRRMPTLAHVPLRGIQVEKDKWSRALPWATRAEAGKVALVRGAWIGAFLDEAVQFKGDGKTHDDQVDSVSGGLTLIAAPSAGRPAVGGSRPLVQQYVVR